MSSNTDADDLDAPPRIRVKPKMRQPSPTMSSDPLEELEMTGMIRVKRESKPVKLEWSDGESDGMFGKSKAKGDKSRDSRSRAARESRRAKANAAKNDADHKRRRQQGETGVGKQHVPQKRGAQKRKADDQNDIPLNDSEEDIVADYWRERRTRFDSRMERLGQDALLLPPQFDDIDFSEDEDLAHIIEKPVLPAITPPAPYQDVKLTQSLGIIPAAIAKYLREYQVNGAAFLHELAVFQRGGILGDDMGLGKTIQVISFLTAMYGKTGDERDDKRMRKLIEADRKVLRTLIICPGSIMANWQDELDRWGWWHYAQFWGSKAARDAAIAQARAGRIEIMITTYTTYRIHEEQVNKVAWDCVIADECHIIKERKAEITIAMNKVNSLCRIGLTGTALQNKYEELWTLLNWANPGALGTVAEWKYTIAVPLKLGQSHETTGYQLAKAREVAKQLVQNLLPAFFLRRTKTLIRDQLPKKTDRVVFCPLTDDQQDAYRNFLESDYVQIIKRSIEFCDCPSEKRKPGQKPPKARKRGWCCYTRLENGDMWQQWVFPCIQYLAKVSNHLALLIPSSSDPQKKRDKDVELLAVSMPDKFEQLVRTQDSVLNYANPDFCGKWKILKALLKFWYGQGNNKVLIFSHSVRLLKMLQQQFNHTDTKYNISYLDGSIKYEERYEIVKDFNKSPDSFVFLISTRAGGVGLNITSANKVVVVDPNWNPSHDLQAQDRAYRIGQMRDVEVYRLVSQGTIEEVVYARQVYKQQQSNIAYTGTAERRYFTGVQGVPDQKGEIFGLQNLFAFHDENVVLRDIVHKTNVAEAKAGFIVADMDQSDVDLSDQEYDEASQKVNSQDEKDDELLKDIAAGITGEARKKSKASKASKHNPVQAILSSVGVGYTHLNDEVIGESKVEAALSKRAAADDGTHNLGRVFLNDSQSQRQNKADVKLRDGSVVSYNLNPPEAIQRRQFGAMAEWAGCKNVVEFALIVEGSTQAERRAILDNWYEYRREQLGVESVGNAGTSVHGDTANKTEVTTEVKG